MLHHILRNYNHNEIKGLSRFSVLRVDPAPTYDRNQVSLAHAPTQGGWREGRDARGGRKHAHVRSVVIRIEDPAILIQV